MSAEFVACMEDVLDLYAEPYDPERPALFVIDREGVVRYAYLGWQQWEIRSNAEVLEVCRGIPCEVARMIHAEFQSANTFRLSVLTTHPRTGLLLPGSRTARPPGWPGGGLFVRSTTCSAT